MKFTAEIEEKRGVHLLSESSGGLLGGLYVKLEKRPILALAHLYFSKNKTSAKLNYISKV